MLLLQQKQRIKKFVTTSTLNKLLNPSYAKVNIISQNLSTLPLESTPTVTSLLGPSKTTEKERSIARLMGSLKKVVQEGDMLPTDIAPAKVLHREGWPGFGGNIAFNDLGQLVVGITLVDPEDSNTLVGESFYFFH